MLERTYTARRFDEALAKIKEDLGPDAVIVSSRKLEPRGLFGGPTQVELTAIPGDALPPDALPERPAKNNHRQARLKALQEELMPGLRRHAEQDQIRSIEEQLTQRATPAELATALATNIKDMCAGEPPNQVTAHHHLEGALTECTQFSGMIRPGDTRLVAMVGPTGVGKTTTIAKVAAQAALIDRYRVGLISLDQYRVGGTEQLGTYADLIGIPLETADSGPTLRAAVERLALADLILIDTAGRAPRDQDAIAQLGQSLQQAGEDMQVHLCLSAATRDEGLQSAVERLGHLGPSRLIMTKLDEAIVHGSVLYAAQASQLPLSYFTTGQRVPEDIEVASPGRLASLLLGEELY